MEAAITVIVLLVVFGFVSWAVVSMSTDVLKCRRCNIRISSIKIPQLRWPTAETVEALGDERRYLDSRVCSKCWEEDLRKLDFPEVHVWGVGATVEYVKNTPVFLAITLSIASLVLSILNWFST